MAGGGRRSPESEKSSGKKIEEDDGCRAMPRSNYLIAQSLRQGVVHTGRLCK
jgi:hypothetical protein